MLQSSRAVAVFAVSVFCLVLTWTIVALRIYTRTVVVKNFGREDFCIILALIWLTGFIITLFVQLHYGMGEHTRTLTLQQGLAVLKPFYVSIIVYNLALSFTKISILFQYLRVFTSPGFRRACLAMLCIITVYSMWTVLSAVVPCWPIRYFWDPTIEGHCLNRFGVWFANAAMNITTDFATALLPMPVLKTLQLPKRQKIALMVVFGLAGFICIVSILRLQSLYVISKSTDVSWDNPPIAIWSTIEISIGITCSTIPTLKAFVSRLFPRIFSTRSAATATEKSDILANGSTPPNGGISSNSASSRRSGRLSGYTPAAWGSKQTSQLESRATGSNNEDEIGMIELHVPGGEPGEDEGIKVVVTVLAQEVEQRDVEDESSDAGSENRWYRTQHPGDV